MPAMTSLSRTEPSPAATRTSTSGAVGATPRYRSEPPAARPATIVPWPWGSPPGSLPASPETTSTRAITRAPKSALFDASMPLSTTAIAGGVGAGAQGIGQSRVAPIEARQISWF